MAISFDVVYLLPDVVLHSDILVSSALLHPDVKPELWTVKNNKNTRF